jgi:hypothetical protein
MWVFNPCGGGAVGWGGDVVVHGCLAAGAELAWKQLTATLPAALGPDTAVPAQAQAING